MNGNFNSQQYQNQPYASYYMMGQQPQAGALLQAQQPAPVQASQPPDSGDYAYSRYGYLAAPPNYLMYQQSVPSQPVAQPHPQAQPQAQAQPQHYNPVRFLSLAAPLVPAGVPVPVPVSTGGISGGSAATTSTTPVQDTATTVSNLTVGQYQPPGIRPRVTTTMWEDEKTLCYQVDANNVSVVRRADNNMINGTKLLNVAQMTRGRRDGILKLEKIRHVVKIGLMHLKGVWIPFERALAMAQREGIVDLLYPLFVRDIKRVIQTGVTPSNAAPQVKLPAALAGPAASLYGLYGQQPLQQQQQQSQQLQQQQSQPQQPQYLQQYNGMPSSRQDSPLQSNASERYPQAQAQQSQLGQLAQQQLAQQGQQSQQQSQQPAVSAQQPYLYQQPYYLGQGGATTGLYYQPYNLNPGYSAAYGGQPMYSYGYGQGAQQVPPQVPGTSPQQQLLHRLNAPTPSTIPSGGASSGNTVLSESTATSVKDAKR